MTLTGSLVNIASNSTQNVVPLATAYSLSKAAVASLSKVAAGRQRLDGGMMK